MLLIPAFGNLYNPSTLEEKFSSYARLLDDELGTQERIPRLRNLIGEVMKKDALAIARACYDAYITKDRAAIEALLAEDFHFTSPLDNRLDRAAYFERCWPNSETTEGFDFIHLVPDGDRVFVTYEGRARGSHFRNTEILTIRGDQITDAEVYFGWSIPHKAPSGSFVDNDGE